MQLTEKALFGGFGISIYKVYICNLGQKGRLLNLEEAAITEFVDSKTECYIICMYRKKMELAANEEDSTISVATVQCSA